MSGRQLKTGRLQEPQIDISGVASGVYILSLKAENGERKMLEMVKE